MWIQGTDVSVGKEGAMTQPPRGTGLGHESPIKGYSRAIQAAAASPLSVTRGS